MLLRGIRCGKLGASRRQLKVPGRRLDAQVFRTDPHTSSIPKTFKIDFLSYRRGLVRRRTIHTS